MAAGSAPCSAIIDVSLATREEVSSIQISLAGPSRVATARLVLSPFGPTASAVWFLQPAACGGDGLLD